MQIIIVLHLQFEYLRVIVFVEPRDGIFLVHMQHDIVFAIVVLIADVVAFLILAKLGDVMGYREDSLL